MAKPITHIDKKELTEEEQRQQELEELQETLLENKEAITKTVELLGNLEKQGILNLLNGLVSEGDQVLRVLVQNLDKPENTQAIRNGLLMMSTLGLVNMKELEPILLKVNAGIERVGENADTDESTGYLDMVRALKDPEVNRAVTLTLNFLKGMGEEKTDHQQNVDRTPDSNV
ncbi:DUF1641 domain-containing protein [Salsuginibacillus kocurii]|uniref:DUF1641 domain-containing protein n=1 Tax=Salsuginibacillus kocurii TaxID=427078 RepID=UPI00036B638F|nr:DUF1641 domain-containing protein [Salsuginibacillus kocurii]